MKTMSDDMHRIAAPAPNEKAVGVERNILTVIRLYAPDGERLPFSLAQLVNDLRALAVANARLAGERDEAVARWRIASDSAVALQASLLGTEADLAARIQAEREAVREACLAAQPCTAEDPNESPYQRAYFDGVMAYGRAIRAIDLGTLPAATAQHAQEVAAAEQRGMERAAMIAASHAAAYRESERGSLSNASQKGIAERMASAAEAIDAAIRAAMKIPSHD
jgi:hypothetical protein